LKRLHTVDVGSGVDGSRYRRVATLDLCLCCLNMLFSHAQQASFMGRVVFNNALEKDVLAAWELDING
jgi:hypothetical protein